MIGIIITGHGHFASGIASTIKLLSGTQEKLTAVDFTEGMTADELQQKLGQAVHAFGDVSGVAFFTDIPGSTPFNQAVIYHTAHSETTVMAGTNVSMVMEVLFQRELSVAQFTTVAIQAGKAGVVAYKNHPRKTAPADDEDGI
ncbi:PTS galactosamine/N-acetylgalactosamine transporter subunit IIA [Schleiferilactobacillus shenzhenensis]|uniref:PTS galactosamine/N-acetylgalactosamine transporter subunit IIA n=1 Tax=Schleiferilactobacillus shenzhenensis TaxID=1231337 RepID=UPI00042517F0|nr:PTS galactosamine/N-acetylgalactosamine transporter subunit IIA [Schleiferilactobacillus shenzhenensis]